MSTKPEDPYLEIARSNLEFWMECYQDQVMEKNHVLNRLRKTEEREWRKILYRWLAMVEEDMERFRKAIENAKDIFEQTERVAEGDVHGHGGGVLLV